ncbi:hypothetical protein PspR76_12255 [Pseudomonas sp. R76]|nr:hypothetical protein PspR76_12255 [Pseudomonas sp. R76]
MGNACSDALRHLYIGLEIEAGAGRGASQAAFPRRAWGRSTPPDKHHRDPDRSHAPRGNASCGALRHLYIGLEIEADAGRGASQAAFPRRAWERSIVGAGLLAKAVGQ